MNIRPARGDDRSAIWQIIEPVVRAGETYALPRDMSRPTRSILVLTTHEVFVAERDGIVGTYYLRRTSRRRRPRGELRLHVRPRATGQGVARAMCAHSLDHANARGFRAMQFNFVVASNTRAVALWQTFLFQIAGRLPQAFEHPSLGFVDAYVMYRVFEVP